MGSSPSLLTVAWLSLLPALGSVAGILLAEWKTPSRWVTGSALHAAAGFATAIAAIELIPHAQQRIAPWLIALALFGGTGLAVLLNRLTQWLRARTRREAAEGGLWGAYSVVLVDLASDGLLTGSGASISESLGLLLALSQVIANLPGGFAVAASLRRSSVPKTHRHVALLLFPVTPFVGALLGFTLLRGAPEAAIGVVLALLAGLLLVATIEDLVPEADKPGAPRTLSAPSFAGGFAGYLLISFYLG